MPPKTTKKKTGKDRAPNHVTVTIRRDTHELLKEVRHQFLMLDINLSWDQIIHRAVQQTLKHGGFNIDP